MPRGGRRDLRLALACLALAASGAVAQDEVPLLPVPLGQSASELAMDRVPPGTTIEQFLLGLYRLNPAAFAGGDLNRLQAQYRLRLPSAEEANLTPLAQAREELARLRTGAALPPAPAVPPTPPSAALPGPAEAVQAAPATVAAPDPAARPFLNIPLWAGACAALALGGLHLLWRGRRSSARQTRAERPAPVQADAEAQAQGRFQPVLPGQAPPPPLVPQAPMAATAAAAAAARPTLFDINLDLDSPPPAQPPLPEASAGWPSASRRPDLNLALGDPTQALAPSQAPASTAAWTAPPAFARVTSANPSPAPARPPGPLDLSGLSLSLGDETPPKGQP